MAEDLLQAGMKAANGRQKEDGKWMENKEGFLPLEDIKRKEKFSPKFFFFSYLRRTQKSNTLWTKTITRNQYTVTEFTCQVSGVSVQYIFLIFLFSKENSHILFVLSTLHIYF